MTTKITGYGPATTVVTGGGRPAPVTGTGGGDRSQAEPVQPAGDSVTLTNSSRTLQKLGEAIASTPVIDGARVESIKSQIAQNTYKVNSLQVAAKLLVADNELPH
jgi:flagellar biosynthesis anti-sigma factor FlgM